MPMRIQRWVVGWYGNSIVKSSRTSPLRQKEFVPWVYISWFPNPSRAQSCQAKVPLVCVVSKTVGNLVPLK